MVFQCSFQSTNYLGLDVRQPTTTGTRLAALFLATPTVTVLLYLYSLVAMPLKPKPTA
jgi:hypothetical protein